MSTAQIRIDDVVRLIVASGDVTATWFQHEDCAKFEHGDRWVSFCGTIAAFAFVIVYEVSVRNGPGLATPEQASFISSDRGRPVQGI